MAQRWKGLQTTDADFFGTAKVDDVMQSAGSKPLIYLKDAFIEPT